MNREPLLVVISGPSGVGKDSILDRLRELNYPIHFTVTATTRSPREGEVHGRDYYFLSTEQFEQLRQRDGLVECACVYGRWYGVPKQPLVDALSRGQDVIMRTNVDGAVSIRSRAPGAVLIFISAPANALGVRLRDRQTDPTPEIELRLSKVADEMNRIEEFDYEVANAEGQLERCVDDVIAIIRAEKCRVSRPALGLV